MMAAVVVEGRREGKMEDVFEGRGGGREGEGGLNFPSLRTSRGHQVSSATARGGYKATQGLLMQTRLGCIHSAIIAQ